MNEKSILIAALQTYGGEKQTDMMIEEMAELTQALCKYRRAKSENALMNIIEEIEDVQIVLDQMKIFYGENQDIRKKKLRRLESRINRDTKG